MFDGLFKTPGNPDNKAYRFPANHEVVAYWQAIKTDHTVPRRHDLDPRGIRGALQNAFILNVDDTDEDAGGRFRIAGSKIADIHQNDLRGLALTDLIKPSKRGMIEELVSEVCRMPAWATIDLEMHRSFRGTQLAQLVLLPMRDHYGRTNRVLGCLDFPTTEQINERCILEPISTLVRPLSNEKNDMRRKMKDRRFQLIEGANPPRKKSRAAKPKLTLVAG